MEKRSCWRRAFGLLGPGLLAALADNDAGGVISYAVTGAKFGYSLFLPLVCIMILLAYTVGMFGLVVLICMFIVPLKYAVKLIFNSILGGVVIAVINLVGKTAGIHVSLNLLTAAIAGILGVPGVLMMLFLEAL